MTTALPVYVTRAERSLSVGLSFHALFAVCTLLLFPLHESAHYLTYRILGIHLHMTLNTASPNDQSQRKPIAELAGPLLNLAVASVAALAYQTFQRQRRLWAALALASAMMRLVIYVLVAAAAIATGSGLSLGNDEPIAAHLWGLPSLTLAGVLTIPFVIIVWSIVRTFQGSRICTILHVIGLGFTMLFLGMLVGNALDPWLFPNR
jgi:hypothetical protein